MWHASVMRDGERLRRSMQTPDREEAETRAAEFCGQVSGGVVNWTPSLTLDHAVTSYLDYLIAERRAPKTIAKYRTALNEFKKIATSRKVRLVTEIDLRVLDAYRAKRSSEGVAEKTLLNDTVTIKQFINFVVTRGVLPSNPLRGYKLRKPKPKPQPSWTADQMKQILMATTGSIHHDVFTVLAETGMRIGEVKYLTWDDVDLDRKVLYVREKQLEKKTNKMEVWKPKTGQHRIVPLSQNLVELFGRLPRGECPWVFSRPSLLSSSSKPSNRMIREGSVLTSLKRVLKSLGLTGHVHTFRHSFISHALMRGVPEAIVRDWVGHVDAQTIRWYTHISDKESHAQMERLFAADQAPQSQKTEAEQ
jgi:site-specific recombinase XerD